MELELQGDSCSAETSDFLSYETGSRIRNLYGSDSPKQSLSGTNPAAE
jgi:hypothetical protein